jgi:hypothetical protein
MGQGDDPLLAIRGPSGVDHQSRRPDKHVPRTLGATDVEQHVTSRCLPERSGQVIDVDGPGTLDHPVLAVVPVVPDQVDASPHDMGPWGRVGAVWIEAVLVPSLA